MTSMEFRIYIHHTHRWVRSRERWKAGLELPSETHTHTHTETVNDRRALPGDLSWIFPIMCDSSKEDVFVFIGENCSTPSDCLKLPRFSGTKTASVKAKAGSVCVLFLFVCPPHPDVLQDQSHCLAQTKNNPWNLNRPASGFWRGKRHGRNNNTL